MHTIQQAINRLFAKRGLTWYRTELYSADQVEFFDSQCYPEVIATLTVLWNHSHRLDLVCLHLLIMLIDSILSLLMDGLIVCLFVILAIDWYSRTILKFMWKRYSSWITYFNSNGFSHENSLCAMWSQTNINANSITDLREIQIFLETICVLCGMFGERERCSCFARISLMKFRMIH